MLKKIPTYLISLIPLSLIVGPLIAEIIFLVLSIYFIIKLDKNDIYLFKNKFFICFIIFCLYISSRSLFTDQLYISLKSSLLYFRFAIYSLAVIYFLNKDNNALKINYNFYKYTLLFLIIALISLYDNTKKAHI